MEDVGNKYFNILLERSLFQGVTEDDFGSVAKCKMHVLVHELAQLISKSESFTWDSEERAGTRSRRLRHVAHTSEVEIISQVNVRKLRSLFSNGEVPSALTDKLPRFKALNVLNLYKAGIEGLPNSIGQLKQLRYLNMGYGIEELGGLNQLKGELTIYDLENTRLSKTNEEYGVLEGLQPQPRLEILGIRNFMGPKFSLWKQLYNLKKIRLLQFDICEEVTMLGHLPNLMHLEFDKMIHLKGLGAEFYGNNADGSVEDTRSTGETGALFPALKTLSICAAPNLTEWKEAPV
ncbi:putative disease resistance RPP13-like protein 1 [Malus domestica]|uniref:putative disease resistance RPP13-like protein 1 n=1 Tax=Malus domestica TaxID=3750 RepID=UPI003975790D